MNALLALSRGIDRLSERIGHAVYWLVLVAVLISAGNAVVRKVLNTSSNAFLEIQWYLFSVIFLFCAGYTLLRNEHVRIDIIAGRLSPRAQAWIDILGTLLFLLPMAIIIMYLSWPLFVDAYVRNEVSTNAGGLTIWPARLMMPVGFALLVIQGDLRAHQAHRIPARAHSRPGAEAPREVRRAGARRRDRPRPGRPRMSAAGRTRRTPPPTRERRGKSDRRIVPSAASGARP